MRTGVSMLGGGRNFILRFMNAVVVVSLVSCVCRCLVCLARMYLRRNDWA